MANGNGPEKKFSAGAVSVSVWSNSAKSKQGENVTYKTISLQRSYKKGNEWMNTQTLREQDVPKAQILLAKAYEYLVVKENGGGNGGSGSVGIEEEELV